mmetsp:Transcript_15621/g.59316  ORF Transcript_15621/g.59316 Transcript_15621/m.59316 type:complete len:248 (-) Transcript_15621:697-1440(-)
MRFTQFFKLWPNGVAHETSRERGLRGPAWVMPPSQWRCVDPPAPLTLTARTPLDSHPIPTPNSWLCSVREWAGAHRDGANNRVVTTVELKIGACRVLAALLRGTLPRLDASSSPSPGTCSPFPWLPPVLRIRIALTSPRPIHWPPSALPPRSPDHRPLDDQPLAALPLRRSAASGYTRCALHARPAARGMTPSWPGGVQGSAQLRPRPLPQSAACSRQKHQAPASPSFEGLGCGCRPRLRPVVLGTG